MAVDSKTAGSESVDPKTVDPRTVDRELARNLETGTHEEDEAGSWRGDEAVRLPALTVLYHPDLERIGERALLPALGEGGEVALSRSRPDFAAPHNGVPRPLADPRISRGDWMLSGGEAGAIHLQRAGSSTTLRAEGRVVEETACFDDDAIERGVVLQLGGQTVLLLHRSPLGAAGTNPYRRLVGESAAIQELRHHMTQVSDLDLPILLRGATGTGKELVARALHEHGPRRGGPLVVVNMAAVPPSLAASELFGAAKGAFTGAERGREGYFAQAHRGTLFLDEIGETPAEVQPLLLRALESGEIQPVGASEPRRVDVRVLSATDADLETMVAEGRLRAPLLHRLRGFQITLPTLDERRDDIGRLVLTFLRQELAGLDALDRLAPRREPWLPGAVVAHLARCGWPGNVRQLRNVVRQLVIANRDRDPAVLDAATEALLDPPTGRGELAAGPAATPPSADLATTRSEPARRRATDITPQELEAALRAQRWRPHAAAHALGIPRASIYDLIAKSPYLRTAADLDRKELEATRERLGGDVAAMADALEVSERALRRRMRELGLG